MIKNTLVITLVVACIACGDEGETSASTADSAAPSARDDSPALADASVGAPEASAQTGPEDASAPPDAARDQTPVDTTADAAAKDAGVRPPLVLEAPVASVPCGESPCETTSNNVCCGAWSKNAGFAAELSCMKLSDCDFWRSRSGDQNRAVPQECDGKEDCSGGQVCCMYAYGAPLCELGDIDDCIRKITGPGGAAICADNDKCVLGATQFIGAGVPLGVLACNDDSDCADRPMTRCRPEEDDSLTTGAGVRARSYVKVCR